MKKLFYLLSVSFIITFVFQIDGINAHSLQPDAVKLFVDNKCNSCHSVKTYNIEVKNKNTKAPDLSNIGSQRTPDFLIKYLKKEIEIAGKKHCVTFLGNEGELAELVEWMVSLRNNEETE